MTDSQVETDAATTTRRAMLAGAGAVGATALLAACGTDDGDSLADNGDSGTTGSGSGATTGAPTGGTGTGTGTALGKTSDIPESGGKVFKEQQVVVTQPVKGTYKGFTATCPHAGCIVANVKGGTINCGCHGSQFSIEDGSVKKGPATEPLDAVTVKVDGDSVTLT